jgi:hypothetical protein
MSLTNSNQMVLLEDEKRPKSEQYQSDKPILSSCITFIKRINFLIKFGL